MIKKRHPLSSKEQKEFLEILKDKLPSIYEKIDRRKVIEILEIKDGNKIYVQEEKAIAIVINEELIPPLRQELLESFPKVIIDMGAVPHIVNGADVMAPGIRSIHGNLNDVVVIVDEKYGKPIAIGKIIMSPMEVLEKRKGKAIKNLHHIGDHLWKLVQS
ncbi:MAG: DUF1947 domain-containing protein [Candidatus Methanomethyliaceae archaeon]|nr:DUF1947 domain-containing protein [Candidatus Methanomethyliaceae archaeon]MCX8169775.1 DUF1947 domain-containing protein [Candidatus Methanomethyliaceae archaeon]MDW7970988.1 DUF1947 domain-containing protein [Nitrososphaerota archaeon]